MMHVQQDDNGKAWLDVPGFHAGQFASSVHGAMARVSEAVGSDLTYDDYVGYSGFAFRVGLHHALCPSAGHPACGYPCLDVRVAPWERKAYTAFPWDGPKADRSAYEAQVRAAVKASIDRGIPVHYGSEEDGLIVGYADGGARWLCKHPYHKGGSEAFWFDEAQGFAGCNGNFPWAVVVWEAPKPAEALADPRDATIAALEQAIAMWSADAINPRDDHVYYAGELAYLKWIDWLSAIDAGEIDDPKSGMQGNGWCFDVLVQNRRIASRWLRKQAPLLGSAAEADLLAAADHDDRLVAACTADLDSPWDLALPPQRADDWTPAMRRNQIDRLEASRDHDATAIAAIERALHAAKHRATAAATPTPE